MSKKKSWAELSTGAKVAVVIGGILEMLLTRAAIKDLRGRPKSSVRGPKWLWVIANIVQPFGPLAYFALGRKRSEA